MRRRSWQAPLILTFLPALAAAKPGVIQVTNIHSWSHTGSTRVILETTGPFEFKSDRAANPDRLFFDILHARPWINGKRYRAQTINDRLVHRVRIAETAPGTTRVVFDLTGPHPFAVSRLEAPDRMVIEIRAEASARQPLLVSSLHRRVFIYPPAAAPAPLPRPLLAGVAPSFDPSPFAPPALPDAALLLASARAPRQQLRIRTTTTTTPSPATSTAAAKIPSMTPVPYSAPGTAPPPAPLSNPRPSENASQSLTRALGLKVNRIVIDAGHGGHDDGTIGPNGVLEKDVVLDVALRLAKLVQSRMGAEVVLTRSDDTFIPLHDRTAMANSHKADLFLSIHANSSPAPAVAGTETFFLNVTSSPGALEVAARENAGAERSVGELKDLIQSITLNDKIAESQTFAQTIQTSLFSQAAKSNVAARNRGVKRAPFVVLIGAGMPSVLAEIGFLSNARDEANLGKPEYRQKIAEALCKGLTQYSQSLSHFEVAGKADWPGGLN